MKNLLAPFSFLAAAVASFCAFAADQGFPQPWQLGFQSAASPVMEKLTMAHDYLLVIITAITIFVLLLLVYICIRYRRGANPVPSKTAHNTKLEIIWTVIPILILVVIAIPSLRIHYFMQHVVEPQMTLKVVGYQWYWHYEYPDNGGFGYDSYMLKGTDLKPGDHRLLAVDNRLVVPVDTTIRVLVTGADVIHAFAVPAFGVKRDAIPGRLNETWFKAEKIGTFYGQCSELCGVGHGFMPIVIDVVSKDDFTAWVKKQQAANAPSTTPAVPLAKPEPATAKNPEPKASQEKKRSEQKGEGKPSTPAPAPKVQGDDSETKE